MVVSVLGGDLRMAHTAKKLQACGATVRVCAMESCPIPFSCVSLQKALDFPDAVLLPFPYTKNQTHLDTPFASEPIALDDLAIAPTTRVFCGRADLPLRARAESSGWHLEDFCAWDSFLTASAVATAEGAVYLSMQHRPITLSRHRAVVVGFGRIAKHLCHLLYAFGMQVCVCARKHHDRVKALSLGYDACDFCDLSKAVCDCDFLYNTVPARVIGAQVLEKISADALIMDLASAPGGVDFQEAKAQKKSYLWALALPSSYAPISAGESLGEAIFQVLEQQERSSV